MKTIEQIEQDVKYYTVDLNEIVSKIPNIARLLTTSHDLDKQRSATIDDLCDDQYNKFKGMEEFCHQVTELQMSNKELRAMKKDELIDFIEKIYLILEDQGIEL